LATAESNRAIPAYQTGPVDRLGRGQRKMEVSSPTGRDPVLALKASSRAGAASSWRIAEVPPPQRFHARPGSSRGPHLGGFAIHERRTEDVSPSELPRPFAFQTTPAP